MRRALTKQEESPSALPPPTWPPRTSRPVWVVWHEVDVHASKKCGQCQAVWYCNEECQRKAWKEHKHHCHKKPSVPKPKVDASNGGDAASAAK